MTDANPSWEMGRASRNTETGVMRSPTKLIVGLIFQAAPVWLLSLTPAMITSIYVIDFNSFDGLTQHLTTNNLDVKLYNSIVINLGRTLFKFSVPPSKMLYQWRCEISE